MRQEKCKLIKLLLLFTTAKLWKQPRCPTTDEWIKKIYTQWNFTQPQG
jgi:hypothetical protein